MIQETFQIPVAILVAVVAAVLGTVSAEALRIYGKSREATARKVCLVEIEAYEGVLQVATKDLKVMLELIDELSRERDTAIRWFQDEAAKNGN